ncbi:hypothetical protein Q4Q35_00605 [Flavivirga aquimarina]|uniref:Uncharacterized protein n=1 Tax=Flavivirga aquimarina TaxID=2027862 RepID=A0ABT8W5A3_9FLAO|nr:hypothetical protein [Flavivirga aquimarina]MDO5968294.1 hypothetical protein [Flavivirga aquimarina]
MIKKTLFTVSVILCFVNMQCEDNDTNLPNEYCDKATVINEDLYNNLVSDHFDLIDADINNDCIAIKIAASGCDGSTWELHLVDSGAVAESSPEQRYLKLQLLNTELCDAYFEKVISFDLTPLQISGSNDIILHLEGLESSLNYTY